MTYIQEEPGSSRPVLTAIFEASTSSSQIPASHLNNTKTASCQIPSNLTSRSNRRPPGYFINTRRQTQSRGEPSDMSCEELHGFSRYSGLGCGSIYNTPHEVLTAVLLKIQVFWYMKPCGLVNSRRGLGTAYYPHHEYPS